MLSQRLRRKVLVLCYASYAMPCHAPVSAFSIGCACINRETAAASLAISETGEQNTEHRLHVFPCFCSYCSWHFVLRPTRRLPSIKPRAHAASSLYAQVSKFCAACIQDARFGPRCRISNTTRLQRMYDIVCYSAACMHLSVFCRGQSQTPRGRSRPWWEAPRFLPRSV